jgi:hypothetical protein
MAGWRLLGKEIIREGKNMGGGGWFGLWKERIGKKIITFLV